MSEIISGINWTTVLTSAIVASIVGTFTGVAQYLAIRYVSKITDHFESKGKNLINKKEV